MKKRITWKGYGIQRKYLMYTIGLLLLALLLSSVGVWMYVRNNMMSAVIEKYEFMNEKMGRSLDSMYTRSNEVMAKCITNTEVQKSLTLKSLNEMERNSLSKYFAYSGMEHVLDYLYIDNKQNIYARSYSKVTLSDLEQSGFFDILGNDYAKTKWIWTEDTLFGTKEPSLFIGCYVRAMEYAHDPGMIFFKMDDDYLEAIIERDQEKTAEIAVGIADSEGNLIKGWFPQGYHMSEKDLDEIEWISKQQDKSGMIMTGKQVKSGVLAAYRQENTGLVVFSIIPNNVVWSNMGKIIGVLVAIYLIVIVFAINLSIYFSRRFTDPIKKISHAMTEFDGNDFSGTIELHTNTELDQIGESYNEMLKNIERQLQEIKDQEKALRNSELNMLIHQINPHFLYNTLDTIYMLARINKEETTMKMIQALSKYLRISLNKGNDMVTIEDEMENVKSYMEIQQIRNADLFRFEIDCQVDLQKQILKLILQPLVENAIKHGFCEIFSGGVIRIQIYEEAKYLVFRVYNSGVPIKSAAMERINAWNGQSITAADNTAQGYGVMNIITRLRLKYGESVQFYYEAEEHGTTCMIKIPEGEHNDEKE